MEVQPVNKKMKSLFAIIAAFLALSDCHEQTPQQTVDQFKQAQSAVQAVADRARPHVEAVVDNIVKPAIDQVNSEAMVVKPQAKQASVMQPAWDVSNSSAKCCYPTGYRDNVECFNEPRK